MITVLVTIAEDDIFVRLTATQIYIIGIILVSLIAFLCMHIGDVFASTANMDQTAPDAALHKNLCNSKLVTSFYRGSAVDTLICVFHHVAAITEVAAQCLLLPAE